MFRLGPNVSLLMAMFGVIFLMIASMAPQALAIPVGDDQTGQANPMVQPDKPLVLTRSANAVDSQKQLSQRQYVLDLIQKAEDEVKRLSGVSNRNAELQPNSPLERAKQTHHVR